MSVSAAAASIFDESERALLMPGAAVGRAPAHDRLKVLRSEAFKLRAYVDEGMLHPASVAEEIWSVAERYHMLGEPGGDQESRIRDIEHQATAPPGLRNSEEPPPVDSFDSFDRPADIDTAREIGSQSEPIKPSARPARSLVTMTPEAWRGTEPKEMRWFAHGRIPAADVALYAGNGGAGKTETVVELLISASANLGDWLGCIVEPGPVLFLSCEEPEDNVRDRVERICKHRGIDPYALPELYIHYPDLEATSLVSVDRAGAVIKSELFESVIAFAREHRPVLIAIDSAAAVFDGDAIARRLVRAFLAMLRKLAGETGAAIVLLDHPSVRGMADGTGTANSVDWRNSVRSMMYLSDPDKDDPDVRTLELKKSNRGRNGEKVKLRWNGLTFTTEAAAGGPSPYCAAADRDVDELFLRLLDKRNAQGRPVRPSTGRGSAPSEMEDDPEANGVKVPAFRAAMERLFTAGKIRTVETGSPAKRRKHIERA
jgi:RecA-family ATPase